MSIRNVDFISLPQMASQSDDSEKSGDSDSIYEKDVSVMACLEGNIEQIKKELANGAKCSLDAFSNAILSGNNELIFLLLKKDKIKFFWEACSREISILKNNSFPSKEEGLLLLVCRMYSGPSDSDSSDSSDSESDFNNVDIMDGLFSLFRKDNVEVFKVLWESAKDDTYNQEKEILQLALNMGSAKISMYLLFVMQIEIPELKSIRMQFNLSLKNFLPIMYLKDLLKHEEVKAFLRLNFNETNKKKYQDILHQLFIKKCTIIEMVIYLALMGTEEDLNEIDEFGLRPVDYAVLGYSCEILEENFFHFLRHFKINITLGDRTILHLACFFSVNDGFISTLLQACEEYFSKKVMMNLINIINLEDHRNIHHRLPWGKIEFINRADSFGLTALHYAAWTHDQRRSVERNTNYFQITEEEICLDTTKIVALLLKAGAKRDIAGPFLEFFNEFNRTTPIPTFMRTVFQEKIEKYYDNLNEKFLQLTPLELTKKNIKEDSGARFKPMIQLFNGEIEPDEILKRNKPINRFLDT